MDNSSQPHNKKTSVIIKRLFNEYISRYKLLLSFALFWMIVAASMTGVFAWIIGPVMDEIMVGANTDMIVPIAGTLLICLVVRGVATYFHSVQMGTIGHHLVADIQHDLFRHMIRLDLQFFQDNHSGSLVARMISDVQVMRAALTDSLTGIGKNLITLVILIGVMIYRDCILALIALTIFPFMAFYVAKLGKKLRSISNRTQDAVSTMTAGLAQTFQAIRQVRAFGKENYESERAGETLAQVRGLNIKNTRTGNLSTPVNDLLVGIILFGIISYGGWRVVQGESTAGDIMSFIAAFLMAYEPMKKLAKLNNNLNIGLGAADRVLGVFDIDINNEVEKDLPSFTIKNNKANIQFRNVDFAYQDGEKVLDAISFEAKAGEVTALVGPSGGGKTTILNLIPRFYAPDNGEILVNTINTAGVSLKSLRQNIAFVSQDIIIFDNNVAANIAYGFDNYDQKQIEAAARAAYAHDFIMDLPNGYDTQLGENGTTLSGGQRQRIALARAFLRNAPILLLDEATSALDNESERFIQESLQSLQKGRTTIVIAHRLSTIEQAHKIIVLNDGQVVEQGSHDELVKKGGLYQTLRGNLE
jgi:subfamily B ATP-binding cassette protein MsbA